MKNLSTILLLVIVFLISTFFTSFAQTDWTKHPNPVLSPGPAGAWDEEFVAFPSVLFDGSTYHMWYSNQNYVSGVFEKIGYATSNDGITWTKYDDPTTTNPPFSQSDPVLNPGEPGTYDDVGVNQPCVLMINNTYHMWYAGDDEPAGNAGLSICHATSSDGITWIKDLDNPVLDVGSNGTWDDVWVSAPDVVFDGSIYHLWYTAWNGVWPPAHVLIGHATSPHPDSAWTKDPNNPVLDKGTPTCWDYDRVDASNVVFDGSVFHMFYSGGFAFIWRIGYARSLDGSSWIKYDNPNTTIPLFSISDPVLFWGSVNTWDDTNVSHCSVLLDTLTDSLKMWYTGADAAPGYATLQVGYATATLPIFADNFDSYTAGTQLTVQNNADWTTWSGTPGTGEDPFVSDAYANSGTNSVLIVQNNDLVNDFGPYISGVYSMSIMFYIPNGKSGYFNAMAEFTLPSTYNWGMNCFLDVGGYGRIEGGSATAVSFSYTYDTWNQVEVVVDLDQDLAEFRLNGATIHQWQWTLGNNGGGSPLQLDANDFFGLAATDEMYFDDYTLDTAASLTPNSIGDGTEALLIKFALKQNYPNPFNLTTTIEFSMPKTEFVTLKIYNLLGQEVATLVSKTLKAGSYNYSWDASDFASGVYFYKLESGNYINTRKLIFMK